MEQLKVPLDLIIDVVLQSQTLDTKSLVKKIFDVVCQNKNVDLMLSNRLISTIKTFVSRLRAKIKKQGGKGSSGTKLMAKKAKSEFWNMKILSSEYNVNVIKDQCTTVLLENSLLKKELTKVKGRLKKLKEKFRRKKKKVKKHKRFLKNVSREILSRAKKMKDQRPFKAYSRSWQHSLRVSMKEKCQVALGYIGLDKYECHNIYVKNKETQKFETVTLIDDVPNSQGDASDPKLSPEKLELIRLLILIKDEYNMSDRAYAAVASMTDLPSLYALKAEMDKAGQVLEYNKTPGDEPGIERNLESIIKYRVESLADQGKVGEGNSTIHVKISGDGTQVGKANNFVNIACTILNDTDTATSETGHEPVVIINGKENYSVRKAHLKNVVHSVDTFKSFVYRGVEYNVVYYLGGDYKFLREVLGMQASIKLTLFMYIL